MIWKSFRNNHRGATIIQSAKVITCVQFGISYWEVALKDEESIVARIIDLPLEIAKRKGITQRLNGTKKLESWLNSSDGLAYLEETYLTIETN